MFAWGFSFVFRGKRFSYTGKMLQRQLYEMVRLTSIKHCPEWIFLFELALHSMKLDTERKEGNEGGKVRDRKRETWRRERRRWGQEDRFYGGTWIWLALQYKGKLSQSWKAQANPWLKVQRWLASKNGQINIFYIHKLITQKGSIFNSDIWCIRLSRSSAVDPCNLAHNFRGIRS